MAQDYSEALADIKQGFQNIIPRVQVSGNKIIMVQGNDTFTFPVVVPVTNTTIMK